MGLVGWGKLVGVKESQCIWLMSWVNEGATSVEDTGHCEWGCMDGLWGLV